MDRRVTTAIILDTRREKQNEVYPVKLRVTHSRQVKYYPCNKDLSKTAFNKAMFSEKPRQADKELRTLFTEIERKAKKVIDDLPEFSFSLFEKRFLKNRLNVDSLNQAFADYIKSLRDDDRVGTAVTYENAITSLGKFKEKLSFSDINPELLNKYQKWMIDKGNSLTTVGIYLRSLRTIFNIAISEGIVSTDNYPFGRRKFEIPKGHNIKKALSLSDISKVFSYEAEKGSAEEMCKDYWIFMYLCNGMNVKDFSRLKYGDIDNDFIYYERAKTARTKGESESIKIALVKESKAIIEKWGNPRINKDSFVFPVLNHRTDAVRERELVQLLTAQINKYMKRISEALLLEKHITTYTARHSFATVLKRSGASTEHISEALGHSNVKTTQSYLDSFEDDSIKKRAEALTAFTNP